MGHLIFQMCYLSQCLPGTKRWKRQELSVLTSSCKVSMWPPVLTLRPGFNPQGLNHPSYYLLVQELPSILFNVALVQVCGQTHEANFRKAKVSELDVPHGCNQQAGKPEKQKFEVISWSSKIADFSICSIFPLRRLLWDISRVASSGRQAAVKE